MVTRPFAPGLNGQALRVSPKQMLPRSDRLPATSPTKRVFGMPGAARRATSPTQYSAKTAAFHAKRLSSGTGVFASRASRRSFALAAQKNGRSARNPAIQPGAYLRIERRKRLAYRMRGIRSRFRWIQRGGVSGRTETASLWTNVLAVIGSGGLAVAKLVAGWVGPAFAAPVLDVVAPVRGRSSRASGRTRTRRHLRH
jgi:hypothetical protein